MSAHRAFALCLTVLVVGGVLALAGDLFHMGTAEAITDPSAIGRFEIICGTRSQKDVYLLDTASGRTWQMEADVDTGRNWWKPLPPPMERRASTADQGPITHRAPELRT